MNTKPKQTETQLDLWEKESLAWYSQKDLKKMVGRILKGKTAHQGYSKWKKGALKNDN